jgi:hypothetical protein
MAYRMVQGFVATVTSQRLLRGQACFVGNINKNDLQGEVAYWKVRMLVAISQSEEFHSYPIYDKTNQDGLFVIVKIWSRVTFTLALSTSLF